MKQHIKFPSIEQFRSVIKIAKDRAAYDMVPLPKIKFSGSVKLHGTNAGVCASSDEFWVQSRENIITFQSDNAGFAAYVQANEDFYKELLEIVRKKYSADSNTIACVFGEWCGSGIQKGVAISQLPKMFVVFGVRLFNVETLNSVWATNDELSELSEVLVLSPSAPQNFRVITEFPTYEMEIDMANPLAVQNALGDLTLKVEEECPVGKQLGAIGIGEGIVWKAVEGPANFDLSGMIFKVKGEKHSVSKVKVLAAVDVEKLESIKALIDSVVTENRLNQGIEDGLKQHGLELDVKNTGAFLKWVANDILKEESDTIVKNGFTSKEVMGEISRKARQWYLVKINSEV
jgi:hypothetical protein